MAGQLEFHNNRSFVTTHWSAIFAARNIDSAVSKPARERLCETYWPPIYGYIRRCGYGVHDAQDLTQEFLCKFLSADHLAKLQNRDGRFRYFLLTFVKHFLSDYRDRISAQKRGGGKIIISIEAYEAEERQIMELSDSWTPDQVFDRRWAQALIDQALAKLQLEYEARGKSLLFEQIKDLDRGEHGAKSYAEIGAELNMSEQAVKNAVHRLRRRFSEVLKKEVADTVSTRQELLSEMRQLLDAIG
jgi:RNA polymerase sigma-70 factor (ECF subfamily)